jgi:hypothetical protein
VIEKMLEVVKVLKELEDVFGGLDFGIKIILVEGSDVVI